MGKKSRRRDNKNTAAVAPPTQRGQRHRFADPVVSLTGDALANPYVVKRDDFRRIPRWPNDGIEQERKKNINGGPDSLGRIETDDPDTIAMTELLGGYPSKSPLCEIEPNPGQGEPGFVRTLPFMFQQSVARQQSDLSSAKAHLIEAYKRKDSDVRRILEEINCTYGVYKGSCDESRFPDFQAILVPLFQKNLASDENIELLFGKVSHVRHLLLDVGSQLADPPPYNSPAGDALSQFLYNPEMDAAPAPKSCAECGLVSEESCSKCAACKSVSYCSVDCQRKHWTIHKPDCRKAQGKKVSEKDVAAAQKEIEERNEHECKRNDQKHEQVKKEFMEILTSYVEEQPKLEWAHDCGGKRLQIYVPSVYADQIIGNIGRLYLDLKQVQMLSLGLYPDGIDPDKYGFRGIEFMDPRNDAHILVLFERLFSNGGEGGGVGLHIEGVFVVEKVKKGKAQWVLIPEPTSYALFDNRFAKLVKHLELAKEKAKPVPETVDLGIHNPGDPELSMLPTQFGNLVSIKPTGIYQ